MLFSFLSTEYSSFTLKPGRVPPNAGAERFDLPLKDLTTKREQLSSFLGYPRTLLTGRIPPPVFLRADRMF
jgi:hypothetical protein